MNLPVAEAVLMDPMNEALNHPVAQEVAQVAQVAQPVQPAQPVPVSMFDLVPGRRYIISNREEGFEEGQETFNATFICLTYVKSDKLRFQPRVKHAHAPHLNLFEDLNGVEHRRRLEANRDHILNHVLIFPIFSYEQGLTQHQLEDLTLDLDAMSKQQQPPNPLSSRHSTWDRPITQPLPGLTYYGHDEHSGYGGGRGRRIQYSNFIDRNFRYQLFKYFIDQNTKVAGSSHDRLPHWYEQPMHIRRHTNRQTNRTRELTAQQLEKTAVYDAIRAAGDENFSDVYFNNHLELLLGAPIVQYEGQPARRGTRFHQYSGRDFFPPAVEPWNGGDSPGQRLGLPPLTPLQDYILKHTRPMIVLPRYWSFTYDPQYQDDLQPGEAEVMAGRIRRGEVNIGQNPRPRRERAVRRTLDGGKRKRKRTRRKRKTRKPRRRKGTSKRI